jgi:hypothetical protein
MRAFTISLLALAASGCLAEEQALRNYEESYKSDTLLLNKVLAPLGVEDPHGQLTVVVGARFLAKLVRASLQPNTLTLSVLTPGRVWSETAGLAAPTASSPRHWTEVIRKPLEFENEVRLESGQLDLQFGVSELALHGDLISMQGTLDGQGQIKAALRFYGIPLERSLQLRVHSDDLLQLHLERSPTGWLVRFIGPPLKARVDFEVPALHVGERDVGNLRFARDISYPLEDISPWSLPLPAPQAISVGGVPLSLGLTNFALGTHEGLLWIGADLLVGDIVSPAPPPAAAPDTKPSSPPLSAQTR